MLIHDWRAFFLYSKDLDINSSVQLNLLKNSHILFSGIKSGDKHIIPESIIEVSKFCKYKFLNSLQVRYINEISFKEYDSLGLIIS